MKKAEFCLIGTREIVMFNNDPSLVLEGLSEQEIAIKRAYRDENGKVGIYTSDLNTSIHVTICRYYELPINKKVTEKMIHVPGNFLPLDDQDNPIGIYRRMDYQHDTPAVIIRAKIRQWAVSGTIYYNEHFFQLDQLKEFLNLVGKRAGVGSYAPRKKGPFGKFIAEVWEPS